MKNVLFVCVENSFRSQMAEGFAREFGAGKVQAYSAGSRPSGEVNPGAIEAMKEKGIDVASQASKGLEDLPALQWDAVVTMGCGDACPHLPAEKRLDWDLPDPKGKSAQEIRAIRDTIENHIKKLFGELEKSSQR